MRYKNANKESLSDHLKSSIEKAKEGNKGLFIYGNTGTGKTYALYAIANWSNADVENFVSLLVEFRDYMSKGFYFDRINNLCNQEYLLIDDIGSEKTSEFVIEFLYLVVNKRYENEKKTVISTNLNLKEFSDRYGDRVLSRLLEMCVFVELNGEDKRLQEMS